MFHNPKVRYIFLAALTMLVLVAPGFGQQSWQRYYGDTTHGREHDGFSVEQTTDGGYVAAGEEDLSPALDYNIYLVKTDVNGDTLWTRTYGGSGDEGARAVCQTTDGGYVVVGQTNSWGAGGRDIYLVKTDVNGDTLWTRTYGGTGNDWGFSVEQTTDGGYIIAGEKNTNFAYLVKTDVNGDTLWTHTYGDGRGTAVHQTTDGGYLMAGVAWVGGRERAYLVKTDGDGDTLWTRTYVNDTLNWVYVTSMQLTSDGGCIMAAGLWPSESQNQRFYLLKANSSGTIVWTRTYGDSSGKDEFNYVQKTTDGGYVVAGTIRPTPEGACSLYVFKTDASGDSLWARIYGGMGISSGSAVEQTRDGGYIIGGMTIGEGYSYLYLVKTDASGQVAVSERPPVVSQSSPVLSASPSVFHQNTVLSYCLPSTATANLEIRDVAGRLVRTFKIKSPTIRSLAWNGTDEAGREMPAGFYFCQFKTAGALVSAKVLLVR